MRFRPSGGLGHTQQRPDREAIQARAEAVTDQAAADKVFDHRHATEIERAENLAAGLPAEGAPPTPGEAPSKRDFRQPNLQTPAVAGRWPAGSLRSVRPMPKPPP